MEQLEYEKLINRGFRIIRINKNKIEIKVKKANWTKICEYSLVRWEELCNNPRTIVDH
jgi:hypothetical protein